MDTVLREPERLFFAFLLIACLVSFLLGTRRVFVLPTGLTPAMQRIKGFSAALGMVHLVLLLASPGPLPAFRQKLLAAVLYLTAAGLFWWTAKTIQHRPFSAIYSTDTPKDLVAEGPYQFIRHPFYLSYLLVWFAGVLATGRLWLIVPALAMLWIYIRAAKAEERKFEGSELTGQYSRYRAITGMFFPRPASFLRVLDRL